MTGNVNGTKVDKISPNREDDIIAWFQHEIAPLFLLASARAGFRRRVDWENYLRELTKIWCDDLEGGFDKPPKVVLHLEK